MDIRSCHNPIPLKDQDEEQKGYSQNSLSCDHNKDNHFLVFYYLYSIPIHVLLNIATKPCHYSWAYKRMLVGCYAYANHLLFLGTLWLDYILVWLFLD